MDNKNTIRICRLTNSEFFLRHHLELQIRSQIAAGFDVHLVYPKESSTGLQEVFPEAIHHHIPFARKPSPLIDLLACFSLYRLLLKERIDILHTITPKAALIGAVVGFVARVPVRIHTFTGQVWANKQGLWRYLLKLIDRMVIALDTKCFADSGSQIQFLEQEGVASKNSVNLIGAGSLSGFNTDHFIPEKFQADRRRIRQSFNFSDDDFVINFTGRVTKDKGVLDLIEAVCKKGLPNHLKLILVGPLEGTPEFQKKLQEMVHASGDRVKLIGYQDDPAPFFAASELFCLPSYREGFGGVLVEAALMRLPAVSTLIPGPLDAVENGKSGILVPPANADALASAIGRYLTDKALLEDNATFAQRRARELFDYRVVNELLHKEYRQLLARYIGSDTLKGKANRSHHITSTKQSSRRRES